MAAETKGPERPYMEDPWADVQRIADYYGKPGSGPLNAIAAALLELRLVLEPTGLPYLIERHKAASQEEG